LVRVLELLKTGVARETVGTKTSFHEGIDAPEPQQMIEGRCVERVVAKFAQDDIVSRRRELVDDLPAPAALAGVLGPDPPLRSPSR